MPLPCAEEMRRDSGSSNSSTSARSHHDGSPPLPFADVQVVLDLDATTALRTICQYTVLGCLSTV
eukprot:168109-Lingulodinium_polyedra.AAC.1